jgi:hypothetical protein
VQKKRPYFHFASTNSTSALCCGPFVDTFVVFYDLAAKFGGAECDLALQTGIIDMTNSPFPAAISAKSVNR